MTKKATPVIHPEAAKHFDEIAQRLVKSIHEISTTSKPVKTLELKPDIKPVKTIKASDIIGPIKVRQVDKHGNRTSLLFSMGAMQCGLDGKQFEEFLRLCEEVTGRSEIRDIASYSKIVEISEHWFIETHKGFIKSNYTEFLMTILKEQVDEIKVLVPIASMRIESDFSFGNVTFRILPGETIGQSFPEITSIIDADERNKLLEYRRNITELYSSSIVGEYRIIAEPDYANQQAIYETQRSLALLRIFTAASFTPFETCFLVLKGQEHIREISTLHMIENKIVSTKGFSAEQSVPLTQLSNALFAKWRLLGLDLLSDILKREKLSRFEEDVLTILLIYSRVSIVKELEEKLIYLFSAIEGLLLYDASEPIQSNLAERLSLVVCETLSERREAIKLIRSCYKNRSDFVHHAQSLSDQVQIEQLMNIVWRFLIAAIQFTQKYKTKEQFLRDIDDLKLTGPRLR